MNSPERERSQIKETLLVGRFDFAELAMRIFQFQYRNNDLYRTFCRNLGRSPRTVKELEDIPFLPVRFFKSHPVRTGTFEPELVFKSSGTTYNQRSIHAVRDRQLYENTSRSIFESQYGSLEEYIILALLPSYLQQRDSSLVYMVRSFIRESKQDASRFYKYDMDHLKRGLTGFSATGKNIILWGVTYALLDFAEEYISANGGREKLTGKLIVLETGGMKGRREELLRSEVHQKLQSAFHIDVVHSEYGMTEMLSQAYSQGKGVFEMGQTLQIKSFDAMDPLTCVGDGVSGRCHVVDLANFDSCSFIATDDLCSTSGHTFEILGRIDHSDIRGCNLLYDHS